MRTIALPHLAAGTHSIRVYALDPGFVLEHLELGLDAAPERYGASLIR